jgi:aldehyde:ferredoxin oxidoreductase
MHTGHVQTVLDEKIKEERHGKEIKTGKIVIGPAGENLVKYASIVSNEKYKGDGTAYSSLPYSRSGHTCHYLRPFVKTVQ